MDLYNAWIKELKSIFDKIRNEKKLKEYLKQTPIAKKFLLHCQKINALELTFEMFKEFCAFRNYGLTDVEKKKYEQLKIRLKQQKDHPSLGLGYIPSMNQVSRLTKGPKQCLGCQALDQVPRLKKCPKNCLECGGFSGGGGGEGKGGYEVWCKATLSSKSQLLISRKRSDDDMILNRYVKVWEGVDDACSIVHLKCGYQYAFYVVKRNENGEKSLKSEPTLVLLKCDDNMKKKKKIFPKDAALSENLALKIPYAPIIVSRTATEVVVLMRKGKGVKMIRLESRNLNATTKHSGKVATWEHIEGASICKTPEVPSDIPIPHRYPSRKKKDDENKVKMAPGRWIRVAETKELYSTTLVVGLKPNASYQFRCKSVDEHYLAGPASDHVHFENIKLLKSKSHFHQITRNNISTTFVVLVGSPKELKIGDTICFVEKSRLDGFTVLAAKILRKNFHSNAYVIEVIWASRLRKGITPNSFVAEKTVLGPHPFTPGYHTGSILFRSGNSFFNESKRIYRTKWIDEKGRNECIHI